MPPPRIRFTIARLMIAVAVAAPICLILRLEGGDILISVLAILASLVFLLARVRPGMARLRAAMWACAAHPWAALALTALLFELDAWSLAQAWTAERALSARVARVLVLPFLTYVLMTPVALIGSVVLGIWNVAATSNRRRSDEGDQVTQSFLIPSLLWAGAYAMIGVVSFRYFR